MREFIGKNIYYIVMHSLALGFLIASVGPNDHTNMIYFIIAVYLYLQISMYQVLQEVRRKSARVGTMNVFLTKDEYEKSMLIHAEQKRPINYSGKDL